MVRAPEGAIVNIDKITFGNSIPDNPDFIELQRVLAGFGVRDFRTVRFMTPLGIVTQEMYVGGKVSVDLKRIDRDGRTYWGTITTKFTAQEAYYTPSNRRGL